MAGERKPGPVGRIPEKQNLNDGTMFRGLSPLPKPIGAGSSDMSGSLITASGNTIDFDHLLQQLREVGNSIDLQRVTVALLGPQCFSAGVIAGIGDEILGNVVDLFKLCKTLTLADLHDIYTGQTSWWRNLVDPTIIYRKAVATLAGRLFAAELRQAAEERDALISELTEALQDPLAVLEGIADEVADGYKRNWEEFKAHMAAGTLEGRFRAGMIFGHVLVDILGFITGVVGAAKAIAKLAAKLPRLIKYALKANLKPGMRKTPAGGGAHGGGDMPQAPTKSAPTTTPPAEGARPGTPPTIRDAREIPMHPSSRLGRVSPDELRRVRQRHPHTHAEYREMLKKDPARAADMLSEQRAIALVERQPNTRSVVAGETRSAELLGVPKDGKMVDLVKTEKSGLHVPVEVKNQNIIDLDEGTNAALKKFSNIAEHTNMNQVSHFEIIARTDSRLPPNYRINNQGNLERLISGTDEWARVEYGGKGVRILRGPIGND
jgi:hypothetical protein